MKCNLMLHCGNSLVDREEVFEVDTPEATRTWTPIPHGRFIELTEKLLAVHSLKIVEEAHSLNQNGSRYFGLLQVSNGASVDDHAWVMGLRNSHDQTLPAGLVAGASVFVCDNLSFHGQIRISRKHTRFIDRDLPDLLNGGIHRIKDHWYMLDNAIRLYQEIRLTDVDVHDIVVRAVDKEVCPVTMVPKVLDGWRNPRYEEFEPRSLWSLFNSFTEALKGNLNLLPARTTRLHSLCDSYAAFVSRY